MTDIYEFDELYVMYRFYTDKRAIDKQRLIALLREGRPLDDRYLSYAEFTPFLADCLDDKVRYISKHNNKNISGVAFAMLAYTIAENIHTKKKAPRERAIGDFAEWQGCSERHLRAARKKVMTDADFEDLITIHRALLAKEE